MKKIAIDNGFFLNLRRVLSFELCDLVTSQIFRF